MKCSKPCYRRSRSKRFRRCRPKRAVLTRSRGDPPVWQDYRKSIQNERLDLEIQPIGKWTFDDAVNTNDHVLTVQTADQQRYANILLTVGMRMN
ncbi:RbsD/FucU domain-containing protein [Novipirellula galeiformis]|uniref:RbsD/FucU domain-containing protein n=1 Tax=Novipirellula galeiformis TaxID=2528004 RepID=UPI0028F45AF8|nr:RbsD/FucU domain-containing protein [Novipirellula galeiformis]